MTIYHIGIAVLVLCIVAAVWIASRKNTRVTRRPGFIIGGPDTELARPSDPRLPR